jgi:hypothetical protein
LLAGVAGALVALVALVVELEQVAAALAVTGTSLKLFPR